MECTSNDKWINHTAGEISDSFTANVGDTDQQTTNGVL